MVHIRKKILKKRGRGVFPYRGSVGGDCWNQGPALLTSSGVWWHCLLGTRLWLKIETIHTTVCEWTPQIFPKCLLYVFTPRVWQQMRGWAWLKVTCIKCSVINCLMEEKSPDIKLTVLMCLIWRRFEPSQCRATIISLSVPKHCLSPPQWAQFPFPLPWSWQPPVFLLFAWIHLFQIFISC